MLSFRTINHGFKISCKYIIHWLKGKSKHGHGIDSPFVYDFVRNVFSPKSEDIQSIEAIRHYMLTSRKFIEITDFGAGSAVTTKKHRTVKSIAKHSSRKKVNKLLYRTVAYIQPDYIVELGTSFGFSTMYMSKASDNQIYTVEGDKAIADLAQKNFEKLELKNVNLLNMSFDAALHHLSKKFTGRGLLFIDGNHTYTATLEYFYFLCKHLRDDSVLIFDDINWSKGMQHAWKVIVKSSKVPLTIELFDVGIVFLKKKLYKQHYIMKY